MQAEKSVIGKQNKSQKREEGELEFIRRIEIQERTRLIVERDGLSHSKALERATDWVNSETGHKQLSLPIEPPGKTVYRIYYRRFNDDQFSDYNLLDIVVNGVLYDWQSTNNILATIVRDRFDPECKTIVTFHPTQEHDFDIKPVNVSPKRQQDEIARRRRISELERELEGLKNS